MKTKSTTISPRLSPEIAALSIICAIAAMHPSSARGAPEYIEFVQSAQTVDAYDFIEITLKLDKQDAGNPFTDVAVEGWFGRDGGPKTVVDGFCDSPDGRTFRIRFMPTRPGSYDYGLKYRQGPYEKTHSGKFSARNGKRRGLLRVDKNHPWHFLWEGTGEHYFWNATTTYWLLGWDDATIRTNIDRLHKLKVNRLRTAICGRVKNGRAWFENVFPTDKFKFTLNPWEAQRPDSVENPGFDVTRFNIEHWRKIERMLRHARDRDMAISIIFYVDGARPGVDPFGRARMGQQDEQRYYRYAVARLAAFSNLMWDVTNEYHLFRNEDWANKMGAFIKQCDPYDHLMSVHGHGRFPFRQSPWADFAMYQQWDESGGYLFMLENRRKQAATGRPIPQVNEEYGYEDHYPTWGGNRRAPARSADNRRRLAWGMYMAGCYQTTGERADTGTGWGPDTGGGWINGRGDKSMVMLEGYGRIVDFFTSIPWWTLEPDNEFFESPRSGSVRSALTHVVYTRDKAGRAKMYIDGRKQAETTVTGETSNWDKSWRLALANELTKDRPWRGELYQVALYDRALSERQAADRFKAGRTAAPQDALVLYDFREGAGQIINDRSGKSDQLNLTIEGRSAVQWLSAGGLAVRSPILIASRGPADKISSAVRKSNCITIEAWIKPANTTQSGPARIVTVSRDPGSRNFTLGQKVDAYEVRFRTTSTSANGEPTLSSPGGDALPRICGLRSPQADLAVLYFTAGGQARIKSGGLSDGLNAQWYNPRNGRWTEAAKPDADTFVAPDVDDWVLLLRKPQSPARKKAE
ncbi:MAG: DUF4038 domain-containing protein [Phycisphaerales bacterium]|nr:MAG: DUF4038 domain-containing protein [Phycisphaerales bacterium]